MQRIFLKNGWLGGMGWGLLGALVGCAGSTPPGDAHAPSEHGGLIGVAYKDAAKAPAAAVAPRWAWTPGAAEWVHLAPAGSSFRTPTRAQGGLAVAIEGDCADFRVNSLGDDWLVSRWIAEPSIEDESGEERVPLHGSAPFALHDGRWRALPLHEANSLGAVHGKSSTEDFWVRAEFAGRGESDLEWSLFHDGKWQPDPRRVSAIAELPGRGVFSVGFTRSLAGAMKVGGAWQAGQGPRPPAALLRGLDEFNFSLQAVEGDLWVLASVHNPPGNQTRAVWRRWSPGGGLKSGVLGEFTSGEAAPAVVFRGASEGYAAVGDRLFGWDGARWRERARLPLSASRLVLLGDNKLWASGQEWGDGGVRARSFLIEGEAVRELSAPESLRAVAAHPKAGVWGAGESGVLYRFDGAIWTPQSMPSPAFAPSQRALARDVALNEAGELMVVAEYPRAPVRAAAAAPHQDEPEMATMILTSSKVDETLRCHAGSVAELGLRGVRGLRSWPAPATESCAEPFLVVDRLPLASDEDAPKLVELAQLNEKLSRDHALSSLQLTAIDGDGQGFAGVAVADWATGERALQALRAHDAPPPADSKAAGSKAAARPPELAVELVCGRPSLPQPGLARR